MTEQHDQSSAAAAPPVPGRPRRWRRLVPRGRAALAASTVVASLTFGGLGFGAGYAFADRDISQLDNRQQVPPFERGNRDNGRPDEFGLPPGGQMGDPEGQSRDFDGDGQPDDGTSDSEDDPTLRLG